MTKILIVEDIADNAELTRRILNSRGYETIHAWDAETGLQMALEQLPDLSLLDLRLPDYDGLTLAGWLRAEPGWPTLPGRWQRAMAVTGTFPSLSILSMSLPNR